MLAANRLNADIPSPSLHLLGSDAGLRAAITPLFSSFAEDGHSHGQTSITTGRYDYDRDKLLPEIPKEAAATARTHTALPYMADPTLPITMAHTGTRTPGNQVVRLFTTSNSARAILGAHALKTKPNSTPTRLLGQHLNPQDRVQSPWQLSPSKSLNALPLPKPKVLNISPMNSSETIVSLPLPISKEKDRLTPRIPSLSLEDTPPRSASIRKGPPIPIKIPNGRIYAPKILVERDADLDDLENRISVSVRAPKLPRRSTKRSKTSTSTNTVTSSNTSTNSTAPGPASRSVSRRPSHASSFMTDGSLFGDKDRDDTLTEASNDEFRFSLGFLLQPERSSVMTTRTGRADSATLPELSPFFASDCTVPPVPIIPPSLVHPGPGPGPRAGAGGGAKQIYPLANSSEESLTLKNTLRPLKQQRRSSGMVGGMSPLASAYSQLTANSRPYNASFIAISEDTRSSKKVEEEGDDVTDYSPAFTAASPLDSPETRRQRNSSSTTPLPLSAGLKTPAKLSPALRRVAEEVEVESPRSSASSRSDLDSPPIKSPASPSHYSSTTPELSPSRKKAKPSSNQREFSVSTPESGGSGSSIGLNNPSSLDSFEIIPRAAAAPALTRTLPSFSSSERRALPKSAVPMSAVSPGLSTGSLDGYLDGVVIDSRPSVKRIILGAPPALSEGTKHKASASLSDFRKVDVTFAPNHHLQKPAAAAAEPRKLKFPPLEGPEFPAIIRPVVRERRPSLPSPVNTSSPNLLERRPSAPSPLTGGPSAIMFTPSSHQPLHAALNMHAPSSNSTPSLAAQKRRAVDDSGLRASELSIRTDHIRTAPRQGLFPYTPFSQSSDMFTPAPVSLGGRIESIANKAPLPSALSTSTSVKLATRARSTRPPTGPRKPKLGRGNSSLKRHIESTYLPNSNANAGALSNAMPVVVESPRGTGTRSRSNTDQTQLNSPFPPSPTFHTTPVKFRGLTLDVAKWTFSQEELQELSRRAICHSADPLAIRLLPSTVLDKDVPAELERLEMRQEELKANYKYQYRRRQGAQRTLSVLLESSEASGAGVGLGHIATAVKLIEELQDGASKSDQISEELYMVSDQISQLRAILDNHSASALAMALRKINTSFMKASAETADLKTQIAQLTAEKEDAWAMADGLERELNEAKAQLEMERLSKDTASPSIKELRKRVPNTVEDVPTNARRVFAARKLSVRRSRANLRSAYNAVASPAPFSSALYTGGSLQSYYDSQPASGNSIPPVPQLDSAGIPQSANTRNRILSRRSESFAGTPLSSSKALADAQNELLQILGVPVRGMTDGGFRRTRSFSDADLRASMFPPSPPLDGIVPAPPGSAHRESRITSLYGAYMSRSDTIATRRMTKKRQTAGQWDMEAIYDGILDDADTLFEVVKPGL